MLFVGDFFSLGEAEAPGIHTLMFDSSFEETMNQKDIGCIEVFDSCQSCDKSIVANMMNKFDCPGWACLKSPVIFEPKIQSLFHYD